MGTGERREPNQEAGEPTEEELRAAYEAQVKRLRVEHVVLETVVTLANLGMRRTGLAPGTEDERDAAQVRMAIESIRALMPAVEQAAPEQAKPIRDALSQLQLAFVRIGGTESGAAGSDPDLAGGSDPSSSSGSPSGGGAGSPSGGSGPGEPGAGGSPPGGVPPAGPAPGSKGEEPGPAQRSGRLWVPGQ